MSASDAAPLPRIGEVFFDVRGDSRSMRLSWYADTGVAVFSIWQGGMCTGTFRLPIADLPRMIETLQRGPQRRQRSARDVGRPERADYKRARNEPGYYGEGDYSDEAGHEAGLYHEGGYDDAGREAGAYGHGGYDAGYADSAGYPDAAGYADPAGFRASDGYQPGEYRDDGYRSRDYRAGGYEPDGYQSDSYQTGGYQTDGYQPAAYQRDPVDHPTDAESDLAGYDQERFVPPYVQPPGEAYPNDNPPAGWLSRHGGSGPAYPADHGGVSAEPHPYGPPRRSRRGYSEGSEDRLAADTPPQAPYSAGGAR
jgi:hypothetical protein